MPYPKRLLNQGEEIALDLRPHWWFFWKHIATGVPLFVILGLITAKTHGDVHKWLFILWAVLAVVWAVWLGQKYMEWNFTHFVVTGDRVIYRTGVLAKHGVEIPIERINNINFHQGIFERMIGAGDLDIESAGRDGQSHFDDIWHPDGVQQEIYRQMEANARKRASWSQPGYGAVPTAAPPSAPARAEPTVPEQLQQLADLRDRGVITQAEFDAKKAQLLERM
ncbi:MAG TPA: PH domain-containing protein [Acidimicrobiia bacterium]|nr:PH domain-containing protein [Acidimicrobiia bacterium]